MTLLPTPPCSPLRGCVASKRSAGEAVSVKWHAWPEASGRKRLGPETLG